MLNSVARLQMELMREYDSDTCAADQNEQHESVEGIIVQATLKLQRRRTATSVLYSNEQYEPAAQFRQQASS